MKARPRKYLVAIDSHNRVMAELVLERVRLISDMVGSRITRWRTVFQRDADLGDIVQFITPPIGHGNGLERPLVWSEAPPDWVVPS